MMSLYNTININESCDNAFSPNSSNFTVALASISNFLCPSDGHRDGSKFGRVNYLGNRGVGYTSAGDLENGALTRKGVGPQDFTDGLSNTAAISESLTGIFGYPAKSKLRSVFMTSSSAEYNANSDDFANHCSSITINDFGTTNVDKQFSWLKYDYSNTNYNHLMTPNGFSCNNGIMVQQGAWTASSNHPNGVNVLLADGSTRFVRESVATQVWRAIGTRNGGEATATGL